MNPECSGATVFAAGAARPNVNGLQRTVSFVICQRTPCIPSFRACVQLRASASVLDATQYGTHCALVHISCIYASDMRARARAHRKCNHVGRPTVPASVIGISIGVGVVIVVVSGAGAPASQFWDRLLAIVCVRAMGQNLFGLAHINTHISVLMLWS